MGSLVGLFTVFALGIVLLLYLVSSRPKVRDFVTEFCSRVGCDDDTTALVTVAIAEAQICLECADHDDFLRTMSTARLALEHLQCDESLCWQNLY